MYAIVRGNLEITKMLVDRGADMDARNDVGLKRMRERGGTTMILSLSHYATVTTTTTVSSATTTAIFLSLR